MSMLFTNSKVGRHEFFHRVVLAPLSRLRQASSYPVGTSRQYLDADPPGLQDVTVDFARFGRGFAN